ncbi:MAG: class I SAM-dependent methyltransferase [Bradymonadia bacterium]
MAKILSPAYLFDPIAADYENMREEIAWSPFPHVAAAFCDWSMQNKRVLDLGCGTGEVTRFLQSQGAKAVGVDISAEMCFVAAERSENIQFLPHDISQPMPFADASFDAVIALGCMEYLKEPADVLADIARMLSPRGRLLAVFERRGADCPGGDAASVLFFDHWMRYRCNEKELETLLKPHFSHYRLERVLGYILEESNETIQYIRVIADK